MHEVGIARTVLEIAVGCAHNRGAARVVAVGVRLGALSGVVPEALALAFEGAKEGTNAADARLELLEVPLSCRCGDCGLVFPVDDVHGVACCPSCGRPSGEVVGGTELLVEFVEVA